MRRWVGNHPKEGLAKVGYKLERKVEKLILLHLGTMLEPIVETWRHRPIFSKKKNPCIPFATPFFFGSRM
jgi:hypothetical protein